MQMTTRIETQTLQDVQPQNLPMLRKIANLTPTLKRRDQTKINQAQTMPYQMLTALETLITNQNEVWLHLTTNEYTNKPHHYNHHQTTWLTGLGLRLATWNINGLSPNKAELETLMAVHKLDIVVISEVHCTDKSNVKIKGLQTYTTNHPNDTEHAGSFERYHTEQHKTPPSAWI